ncbi:MAG TPA: hypothetical protein VKP69_22285 [Isosphaeraceae bacterium]|nr:hypothetical protein [Isosphaeraceae bacterium]
MSRRFDDLLASAAEDGASTPVGVFSPRDGADTDQLMQAWYIERQNSIECSLLLDRARRLLGRILYDGEVTAANRQRTRSLLRAIKEARQGPRPRGF